MRTDGTTNPRKATALRIGFLSAVDMPAHEGAEAVVLKARIHKSETTTVTTSKLVKSIFSDALREKQYEADAAAMIDQMWNSQLYSGFVEAAENIAKDPNIPDDQKPMELRRAVDEFINTLHSAMLAASKVTKQTTQGADMATEKELAKFKALAEMTDVQKQHFGTLSEVDQASFIAMSADDREAVVKALTATDESFTDIDGAVVTKSKVGDAAYAVMKSQNARLVKMQNDLDMSRLTKQAEADLSHLPGDTVLKAKVLKAIEAMPQSERDALVAMLKAGDAASKEGFVPAAKQGGEGGTIEQQEEALIAKARAENPDMPKHELLRKVYASEEYKKLMDEESN